MSEPFAAVPDVRQVDMLTGTVGPPEDEDTEALVKETQLRWTGAWW